MSNSEPSVKDASDTTATSGGSQTNGGRGHGTEGTTTPQDGSKPTP